MSRFMDAKYNKYLDNTALRLALIATGFLMWAGAGYGLLKLAI